MATIAITLATVVLVAASPGATWATTMGSLVRKCPSSCASPLEAVYMTGTRFMWITGKLTISECQRSCFAKGRPYYQYNPNGGENSCGCYRTCSSASFVPKAPPVVIGYDVACAGVRCPTQCAVQAGFTFISSPKSSTTSNQKSLQKCQDFCKGTGKFYQYGVDESCSCFADCTGTKTINGIVPSTLGYLRACK